MKKLPILIWPDMLSKAEKACWTAVLGRRRLFGQTHPLYRESMLLMIDICKAQRKKELANAYEADLEAASRPDVRPVPEPAPPTDAPSLVAEVTPQRSTWFGLRKSQK